MTVTRQSFRENPHQYYDLPEETKRRMHRRQWRFGTLVSTTLVASQGLLAMVHWSLAVIPAVIIIVCLTSAWHFFVFETIKSQRADYHIKQMKDILDHKPPTVI